MPKFTLSIDLFTPDVADAVDVAKALRTVADRLAKFASLPWSPYALDGKIYAPGGSKKVIGSWAVEPEHTIDLKITEGGSP